MTVGAGDPLAPQASGDAAPRPPLLRGLAIGLLVAAVLTPFLFFEPFRLLEARLYDLFSTMAPPRPDEPGVTVVAIDEPSFAEVNQRWPWPRDLHATLIQRLRAAGAKVIALDIIFAEPSTDPDDRALAAALGPDVVLAADDVTTTMEQATQVSRVGPLPGFIDAGAVPGVTSVDLDGDAYLRRMPQIEDGFAAHALQMAGYPVAKPPAGALIQYFGPPRSYPTISYYQALDPERFLPPGRLKDQIVFVGLSLKTAPKPDTNAADAFATPYTMWSHSLTAGVEIQATIFDNLRHRLFVVPMPTPAMACIVVLCALGAAGLSGRRTSWRTGVIASIYLAVIVGAAWAALRFARVWAPPALPAAAALSVFGVRVGLDFAQERRLRRAVSEAFSRYVAPELVKQLVRDPSALKLGGERRKLSILFCDVRGFTTISEILKDEPERLTALINRLLDALSEAVLSAGGTIDKYIGDCVMAFWNAPLPAPDHAVRSIQAALRMIEAVSEVNDALTREGAVQSLPRFAVGVGVNTGECVVGNIGSRWRYDYSVLGDCVNLASRLEGLCKEYGVPLVIGPETAEAVRDAFVLVELDRIAVRGRSTQSSIFTVVAPAAHRDEPAVAELVQSHERLLECLRSQSYGEAWTLLQRCRELAPDLAVYYGKLAAKHPGLATPPATDQAISLAS